MFHSYSSNSEWAHAQIDIVPLACLYRYSKSFNVPYCEIYFFYQQLVFTIESEYVIIYRFCHRFSREIRFYYTRRRLMGIYCLEVSANYLEPIYHTTIHLLQEAAFCAYIESSWFLPASESHLYMAFNFEFLIRPSYTL